jgi:two-component system, cell cycle sensor histidine kinase and response regulator CckA
METRSDGQILVVEDDEPLRALICAMLAQSGFQTLSAADGVEALNLIEDHAGRIGLVLTDVIMPRMDGGELARYLRHHHPEILVVLMSGYAEQPVIDELEGTQAVFLSKPFTPTGLASKIRELLDEAPCEPQDGP